MDTRIKPCEVCGGKIGPDFYIVKASQALVDYGAVNRMTGLNTYFQGHSALAEIFFPDSTLETVIDGKDANQWTEIVLCQNCFMTNPALVKIFTEKEKESKEGGGDE